MFFSLNSASPSSTGSATFFSDQHFDTSRKLNTSESIRVPTSEHVAEIVGRQAKVNTANYLNTKGVKIKELRSRTGTYIKTPVKDEEPVFIITGRKENIQTAKREILEISANFSRMRSSKLYGNGQEVSELVRMELWVPYDMVGLVVGPKGATIVQIQESTQTYIKTPNRDQKPVFRISGIAENVLRAKDKIRSHVLLRTGKNLPESCWKMHQHCNEEKKNFYEDSLVDSEDFCKSLSDCTECLFT